MLTRILAIGALLTLEACCCMGLFQTPGTYDVYLDVNRVRQDISFARDYRTEKAIRDRAKKIIIVTDNSTGNEGVVRVQTRSDDSAKEMDVEQTAVISKQVYNSSMSSLEKALIREGFNVLDRNEFARLAREKSLKADELTAQQLLGADAILKIYKVEIIEFTHEQDMREHRIWVQPTNPNLEPWLIEKLNVRDFYCHIDGKLIMSDGTVACVGDIHYPASQMVDPESYKLVYDLISLSENGAQYKLEQKIPEYVFDWRPEVHADSTWRLPQGLVLSDKNLRNLVIRHAAREFVKRLFSGDQ